MTKLIERFALGKLQKVLKVTSIVEVVVSLLVSLASVALLAGALAGIFSMGETINETSEAYELAITMMTEGLRLFITFVLMLVVGLLGLRASNRPRKVVALIVFSSILTFCSLCDLFFGIWDGNRIQAIILDLVFLAGPAICLVVSSMLRMNREILEPDELPGGDGAEFEDGFNPKKLGFMRFIQVLCAINIAITIAWLTTLIKGNYELEFARLLDLLNLIFDGVLFWLLWQRSKATRPFAICFSLFNITLGTIFNIVTGNFQIVTQIFLCLNDIIILFYFLFSRRAKAILSKPFSLELVSERANEETEILFNLKSWGFWRSAIIYFCVFSVVGHWMEAGFCTLIKWGIIPGIYDPTSQIWSDWLYPFPVYGFGTLACILVLFPIKNLLRKHIKSSWQPLVLSFIINTLFCTAIELVLGLLQNQPVNGVYPLWDYSNMFCNFMGQVCLQNSLAFGLVATLMTWVVYPGLERLMRKLPENVANVLFIVIFIFFSILAALYIIKFSV